MPWLHVGSHRSRDVATAPVIARASSLGRFACNPISLRLARDFAIRALCTPMSLAMRCGDTERRAASISHGIDAKDDRTASRASSVGLSCAGEYARARLVAVCRSTCHRPSDQAAVHEVGPEAACLKLSQVVSSRHETSCDRRCACLILSQVL